MIDVRERSILSVEKQREKATKPENWTITLPPNLRAYQSELETLLSKVFAQKPMLPENIALAEQMSLNWCNSKCREAGISLEDAWQELN